MEVSNTVCSILKNYGFAASAIQKYRLNSVEGKQNKSAGPVQLGTFLKKAESSVSSYMYSLNRSVTGLKNAVKPFIAGNPEGQTDRKALRREIDRFREVYDSAVEFANRASMEFDGAQKYADELKDVFASGKAAFEEIGIKADGDGTLVIDGKKLEKAINEDLSRVKDLFGQYDGIAKKIYEKAQKVISSPLEYSRPNDLRSEYRNFFSQVASASPDSRKSSADPVTSAYKSPPPSICSGMIFNMLM